MSSKTRKLPLTKPLTTRARDGWRRLLKHRGPQEIIALAVVGVLVVAVMTTAFCPAAQFRGEQMGVFQPLISEQDANFCIQVVVTPESEQVQLELNPEALAQAVPEPKTRGYIKTHVRRFNRAVANRRYSPSLIPDDNLFEVSLIKGEDQVQGRLRLRDLAAYNQYPVGSTQARSLGNIYMRPSQGRTVLFSDGQIGLMLEQGQGSAVDVSLDQPGLYYGNRFNLVDPQGRPQAGLWVEADSGVFIQPQGGNLVYIDNNAAHADAPQTLNEGQIVEVAGRFFETRSQSGALLAGATNQEGKGKRIYPFGKHFHPVGPLSTDRQFQSLGMEYLFQEYLEGLPEQGIAPGTIWLTLDPRMQTRLSRAVDQLADISAVGHASGLVMDTHTGAILAMAAQPEPYDPGDRDQVLAMLRSGSSGRANHGNFERHIIGSVAKPFVAFAAAHVDPRTTELHVITGSARSATFFGHYVYGKDRGRQKTFEIERNHASFNQYLPKSDNTYQHSLGLLMLAGMARLEDVPEPWLTRSKGRWIVRPDLKADPLALGGLGSARNRLVVQHGDPFVTQMRQLFDLETSSGKQTLDDRDLGIYSGLIDFNSALLMRKYPELDNPKRVLLRRSAVCAPERARMALEDISSTKDASNILFGGYGNRWTDVKLCESFSRIVSGKRVRARLVYQYRDTISGQDVQLEQPAEPMDWPDTPQHQKARAAILDALKEVPQTGTASDLAPTLRRIRAVRGQSNVNLWAKTGTLVETEDPEARDQPSRLFLATISATDNQGRLVGPSLTFVFYLKRAQQSDAIFDVVAQALPQFWEVRPQALDPLASR